MEVFVYADGGSRGNPGRAGAGILFQVHREVSVQPEKGWARDKETRLALYLGDGLTNNQAEYLAVVAAFKYLRRNLSPSGISRVLFFLDSKLLVKQLKGEYRVKNPTLKNLYQWVKGLEKQFQVVEYRYIGRDQNKEADALVNLVLDIREGLDN